MNYGSIVFVGVITTAILYYLFKAHEHYKAPVLNVRKEQ